MESRTKKILIGVGLAIAGLAVVFIGLIVGLIVWIGQPTPLVDSVRLLSGETTGYAELSLDGEDPGTVAFLERFQEAGQESSGPGEEPQMFFSGNLANALPIVAAWTMTPAPNDLDGDLYVGILSLPLFGKWLTVLDGFMGLVGGGDGVSPVRYNDERIYDVNTRGFRGALFLREGTLFVTSDVLIAQTVVDLLADDGTEDANSVGSPLGPLIDQTPADVALRGAITNANGELLRLLAAVSGEAIPPEIALTEIDGTYFSGSLDETGGLEARATILSTSRNWTETEVDAIRAALTAVIQDWFPNSEVVTEPSGTNLLITASVPSLAEGLVDLGNEIGNGNTR